MSLASLYARSLKMPKCAMKNCKNITSRTLKKDGVSYFRFPRNPIRCGEWASIVSQQRREDFKPNKSSVVCSKHFSDEDMYVTAEGLKKRLLKTAIPKVVIKIPDDGSETEVRTSSMVNSSENKKKIKSPTTSLSIASFWDAPQAVALKSELDKCNEKLISKDKVIINLRKKNSRLAKQIILLKNALKVLKKRYKLESKCQDENSDET